MKKVKLSLAALLFASSASLAIPPVWAQDGLESLQTQIGAGGDCIYAEYLSSTNQCSGLTTRLCKGPPECKA